MRRLALSRARWAQAAARGRGPYGSDLRAEAAGLALEGVVCRWGALRAGRLGAGLVSAVAVVGCQV